MKYLKTIYSLQFPEVRSLVQSLWEAKPHYLYDDNYHSKQVGKEAEFLAAWKKWAGPLVDLKDGQLPYFYATAGSSEAIRESIWELKRDERRLIVFENDYEGYVAFATSSKLEYKVIKRDSYRDFKFQDNDSVYFSHPSSIDGSFWSEYNNFMDYMEKSFSQVQINVDLCYVGTTSLKDFKVNLNYNNIKHVFISLSKTYGVYFHRIGGVLSKEEMPGLYGNQWFKNMFALELGIKLMQSFPVNFFHDKYLQDKKEVIEDMEISLGIKAKDNDVLILAVSDEIVSEYQRGSLSRICITPALVENMKKHSSNQWHRANSGLEAGNLLDEKFEKFRSLQVAENYSSVEYAALYHETLPLYREDFTTLEFKAWMEIIPRTIGSVDIHAQYEYVKWALDKCQEDIYFDRKNSIASVANALINRLTPDVKKELARVYKDKFKGVVPQSLAALLRQL